MCAPSERGSLGGGRQVLFWAGIAVLVVAFFVIQAALEGLPNNWLQSTLLVLTVLGEFGLVAVWNRLLG